MNVAVLGAGPTGVLTASLISKKFPDLTVTLWEKEDACKGGRMSTHQDPADPASHVDMGAQYITHYPPTTGDHWLTRIKEQIFHDLITNNVLIPFQGLIEGTPPLNTSQLTNHYVCPNGLSAVPNHILAQSKINTQYNTLVRAIDINKDQRKVLIQYNDSCYTDADVVIITFPIPQFLSLKGNIMEHVTTNVLKHLTDVSYSSRYAIALFFSKKLTPPTTSWTAKYFDHHIIRYACWDALKYAVGSGPRPINPALLVHSTVPFGLEQEHEEETVTDILTTAAMEVIPGLPHPSHTHIIKWRYSQVHKGYAGTSNGHVVISDIPLVILTGDSFTRSNFEGCIEAGFYTTAAIERVIVD